MSDSKAATIVSAYPWQRKKFEHITELWKNQTLPHALLVKGEPGLGKLEFTKAFAQYVFCQAVKTQQSDSACGQCKECHLFSAGTHPDLLTVHLEINEKTKVKAKQIKVDQIRHLIDFVGKTSQREGMKVIIIEPAETMNLSAANALLKSLEEPTAQTIIFLVTHATHRLLPTIRSRCQTITIDKPSHNEAIKWLGTDIQDSEKVQQLLTLTNYSPLQAKRLNDSDFLSVYQQAIQFILQATNGQANPVLAAEKFNKLNTSHLLQAFQQLLWDLIKLSQQLSLEPANPLLSLSKFCQAPGFSKRAYLMLEEIQQANQELSGVTNPNPQLLLESVLIRFAALMKA